jgi:hypothetical protein
MNDIPRLDKPPTQMVCRECQQPFRRQVSIVCLSDTFRELKHTERLLYVDTMKRAEQAFVQEVARSAEGFKLGPYMFGICLYTHWRIPYHGTCGPDCEAAVLMRNLRQTSGADGLMKQREALWFHWDEGAYGSRPVRSQNSAPALVDLEKLV